MLKFYCYKITNTVNNKIYVGKTNDIKRRFSEHKSSPFSLNKKENNACPKLYRSIRKYGIEKFNFEIIDSFDTELECLLAEEKYIEKFDCVKNGLNILKGGKDQHAGENSVWYGRHHTEETKQKISNTLKEKKICVGENNPMFGKHHSEETKAKISKINKGRKQTQEHRKKNSEANKGEKNKSAKINKKIADQIRTEYATGEISSIKLSKKYGISKRMILNIIHNKNWI